MIETNRDLLAMQQLLDREILRMQGPASRDQSAWVGRELVLLCRQRIAVCAALVNRRLEAPKKVVVFSRWVSGDGVLGDGDLGRIWDYVEGEHRRRRSGHS
jgi:hypothetical protein